MKRRIALAAGIAAAMTVIVAIRGRAPVSPEPAAPSSDVSELSAREGRSPSPRVEGVGAPQAHAEIGPDPAVAASDTAAAISEAFSRATGLLPLPPERLSDLHGALLEERLRAFDAALEGKEPPPPPPWFESERTTLANRYFEENPSARDAPSADLARKQAEYERLVAHHLQKYGETNLERLAEAKQRLFFEHTELPRNEITNEEKPQ